MPSSPSRPRIAGFAAITLLFFPYGVPAAGSAVSAHLEGGPGSTAVAGQITMGGSVSAGLSVPLWSVTRAAAEFSTSASSNIGVSYIPEGPIPGDRSLTTFLLGVEAIPKRLRGPFLFVGCGGGHSKLNGALGEWQSFPNNVIPPRDENGFAFGGGIGYRFSSGPGPLGFQLAIRVHAVVRDGEGPASATSLTLGLAY